MTFAKPSFQPLTGYFEPSAVQQLPGGQFLVVEDEKDHALSLLTLKSSSQVHRQALRPGWFRGGNAVWNLDDLEGLTMDTTGHVYAITSHSRNDKGQAHTARDQLARFQVVDGDVTSAVVVSGLKEALGAAHPVLAEAALAQTAKSAAGLNIEALEITPDGRQLLLGFRSPLQGQLAIVAAINNPADIFESKAPPAIAPALYLLDLGGQGIRGMAHVPSLQGYLVIGGPVSKAEEAFSLWFWTGGTSPCQRVSVPGLADLGRVEGVCAAVVDGQPHVLLVCDDGNRKQGQFAHFVLLHVSQLHVAPAPSA